MSDLRGEVGRLRRDVLASHPRAARSSVQSEIVVPDIEEFVYSDRYLRLCGTDRAGLFPRQLTLLKILFLQSELFTAFDRAVIEEWVGRFERGEQNGIQPDIVERIARNKGEGQCWFRETLAVLGRRGSKNFLGAIAGAYVLFNHVARKNPQEYYGLDPDETLTAMVIASKHDQARDNQ